MPESTDHCLRVGITGGIGSGKTTASQIFQALGIPVYNADYWAKWLITNRQGIITQIQQILGKQAYRDDGTYNRQYVADLVFKYPEKLEALNAIVHPAVEAHSMGWHNEKATKGVPYTLKEAALLIESKGHKFLDKLIVVTAPEDIRIQRVIRRDEVDAEAVKARIARQMPEADKVVLADYVIVNDGKSMLLPQVWKVHQALISQWKGEN